MDFKSSLALFYLVIHLFHVCYVYPLISFTVNLNKGNDIALHLNPRFNEDGRKVIVRNSLIANQWGREERQCPSFPFVHGKPFEVRHPTKLFLIITAPF